MRFTFTITVLVLLVICVSISSKTIAQKGTVVYGKVIGKDTIPFIQLKEVRIVTKRHFKNKKEKKRWNRLYRDVVKVYPYAKKTGSLLREIDSDLAALDGRKDKRAYVKEKEAALKAEFEDDIRNMTLNTPSGEPVFLKQVSSFVFDLGPSEIWRKNKARMIQVSANK
ncbi:MAG: DUF4294 domain-containing protein, partial [Bacteroidetes bacterium]|nr:DUF4294 domain-containing protein [Bacteroidota bacterium]